MMQNEYQAQRKNADHVKTERYEKEKEEPIITPPNAVIHPRTMMIKCLKQVNPHQHQKYQPTFFVGLTSIQ